MRTHDTRTHDATAHDLATCPPSPLSRLLLLELLNKGLDPVGRGRGHAGLRDQHLALLVDNKDTALGRLGALLEADGLDEGRLGVAQQRVRELLLLLELGVVLGRVGAQAVDGETVCRQGLVGVAEEADLGGALAMLAFARQHVNGESSEGQSKFKSKSMQVNAR